MKHYNPPDDGKLVTFRNTPFRGVAGNRKSKNSVRTENERGFTMDLIAITNRPKFLNPELEKATKVLMNCDMQIKARQYDIAAILAEIDNRKLYEQDGFASAVEYANTTFGIQKSVAYLLIEVGTNYTRPILNGKGKCVGHCSNLLPPANPTEQDAPLIDFTTGQLSRVTSLGRETVLKLVKDGDLTPTMTYKEINALVKLHKPPKELSEAEPDENHEEATQADSTPSEAPVMTTTGLTRGDSWDNVSTDMLISELRLRGFKVIDRDGNEVFTEWE